MAIIAAADGCANLIGKRGSSISELKVLLTDKCNLSCTYCPAVKNYNELPPAAGHKGIKDFLALSTHNPQITFSGGEPLLAFPSLVKTIEKSAANELNFTLLTNGTLTTPRIASYLKEHNFEIKVSIDGNSASHNRCRKRIGKASFSSARHGLMEYMKGGYPVKANLVFSPLTVSSLVDNLKYIAGTGVRHIDIQGDIISLWQGESLSKAKRSFDEFVNYYVALFEGDSSELFMVPSLRSLIGKKPLSGIRKCDKVSLFPDGKYYLCDRLAWFPQKERALFCIGSAGIGIDLVKREAIFKGLFSQMRKVTSSRCQKCAFSHFCPCLIGGFFASRKLGMPYEEYFEGFCALSRVYLKSYLRIFSRLRNNPRFIGAYS